MIFMSVALNVPPDDKPIAPLRPTVPIALPTAPMRTWLRTVGSGSPRNMLVSLNDRLDAMMSRSPSTVQ